MRQQFDSTRPELAEDRFEDGQAIVSPDAASEILIEAEAQPGEPTLLLMAWEFQGNKLFDSEELRSVLASLTGRNLTINQLYSAARIIEQYYASAGYVAQATLPPQEVVDGVVRVQVVEAKYAGVEFEGALPKRVRPRVIQNIFDVHVPAGDPLKPAGFDLPNLLANDLPGVAIKGAFAPGRNPGETVLLLDTVDAPLVFGQAVVDYSGSRATGQARGLVQFGFNSPLGFGDLLRTDIFKTEGSESVSASYSLPLGYEGARIAFTGSLLRYDVITPEMQDLDVAGESLTRGISFSAPIARSRDFNLNFSLSYSVANLENSVRDELASDYRLQQTIIGLNGNWRDDFAGGALTSFGVSVASGSSRGADNSGPFERPFDVLRFNMAREQYVRDRTSLFLALSAQNGSDDLDSAEQFSLGGPNGVRAYPVGEAGGPRGALLNVELRHQIDPAWTVTGFYDHGIIAGRDAPNEPSSYHLKGVGATLNWAGPSGWEADLTWAHRIGSNPNPIIDVNRGTVGRDQDGSLDKNRFWFTVSKTF